MVPPHLTAPPGAVGPRCTQHPSASTARTQTCLPAPPFQHNLRAEQGGLDESLGLEDFERSLPTQRFQTRED